MTTLEDFAQENAIYPWLANDCMADNALDQNYNADLLDAMADMAYEQEQAMRESNEDDWTLVDRTDGIVSVDLLNSCVNLFEDIIHDDETH